MHVSLAKLVNIIRYAYYITRFLSEETKYQMLAVSMALFFIPADISLKLLIQCKAKKCYFSDVIIQKKKNMMQKFMHVE